MGGQQDATHVVHLSLTDDNKTIKGFVNFTGFRSGAFQEEEEVYDSKGAATFVIAVIMVYGLSIVLMIASLAKQNMKIKDQEAEEKQILRYLNQASDLREKGAKESYRQLKRNIINIVNRSPLDTKSKQPDHNQDFKAKALSSLIAVGSPTAAEATRTEEGQTATTSELQPDENKRHMRKTSQSESLKPLLEEEEPSDSPDGVESATQSESQASLPGDNQPGKSDPQREEQNGENIKSKAGKEPGRTHALVPIVIISNKNECENGRDVYSFKPLDIKGHDSGPKSQDEPHECKVELTPPTERGGTTRKPPANAWLLPSPTSGHPSITPSPTISSPGSFGYELLKDHSPTSPSGSAVPLLLPPPNSHTTRPHSPSPSRSTERRANVPGYAVPVPRYPSSYDGSPRSPHRARPETGSQSEDLLGDLPDDCLSAHDLHRILVMSDVPRDSGHASHVDRDTIQISSV